METLKLTLNGLYTDPNPLSEVPEGALEVALDAVLQEPSVGDVRRGQARYGLLPEPGDKFYSFENTLLVHYGNFLAYDSNGAGTFTQYSGDFASPDGVAKPRAFEGNQNFYITSDEGIKKLSTVTSSFTFAGAPQGLFGTYELESPGFMSDDCQVAYRIVWGYVDANDNEVVGAPSQRLIVINDTGTTANVEMTWAIPDGITTDWFYRVYRSAQSANAASSPSDELGQIKQGTPSSADIIAGEVTFTDIVPNSLRGATLYTSPSQQGINQSNFQPPYAIDICGFRNRAWYANTKLKQRYSGTLVSVGDNTLGGSFGYQTNNGTTHTNTTIDGLTKAATVVIQDLTYTADVAGVAGNSISITYTGGGTAGAEVVTVNGNDISVQIQNGVSTSAQISTAVTASVPAAALVNVSAGSGATQTTQAQTYLEDGFDTTYLNVGMRVVGTGVQSGTLIVSIDSSSSITVTPATTASATVAMEFQDRFSIDSMNYWAASTSDFPNRQFEAVLDETPGLNIEQTTLNLVAAINSDPNNSDVYAFYTSDAGQLPGQFRIEERDIGGSAFALTSTNGESFSPQLPSSGLTAISDNDARQNRLYFSKNQQYEAVPLVNFLDIGSENFPIVRILANRDSIFVFKAVEGIFRVTGTGESNFIQSLFNDSAKIRAAESAVVLNNKVFAYSDQGVISVSEEGVSLISDPYIQTTLNQISSSLYPNFDTATFGVSYETDKTYQLWTVSEPGETFATQGFCWNDHTQAWTVWDLDRSAGFVLPADGKEYMANPGDLYVYQERKNFNRTDYADREIDVTIVSSDGTEVVINDTTEVTAGDVLKQDGLEAVVVELVDSTTLEVNLDLDWTAGDASIFQVIPARIQWVLNSAGNPGILKHFQEATFFFKNAPFYTVGVGFNTDLVDTTNEIELSASGQGWGQFLWGQRPWGTPGGKAINIRTLVPLDCQRASWINVSVENREAFSNFSLAGVSIQFEPMSSRQR